MKSTRPVPLHREKHPDLNVKGCFGCKATGIRFGAVPGGTRDKASGITQLRQKEKDLARYAEKRKAGEQPDGISKDKQERYEKRVAAFERSESRLADDLPAESLESLKKSTFNKQEK